MAANPASVNPIFGLVAAAAVAASGVVSEALKDLGARTREENEAPSRSREATRESRPAESLSGASTSSPSATQFTSIASQPPANSEAMGSAVRGLRDGVVPGRYTMPERQSPVQVNRSNGGGWNISLPTEYSILAAVGVLFYTVATSGDDAPPTHESSSRSPRSNTCSTTTAATPPSPESDQDDESDTDASDGPEKHPAWKVMNDLFKRERGKVGEKIYEKLSSRARAEDGQSGSGRTAWSNKDYRIDVGHRDGTRGVRQWEFQVNKEASKSAKKLLDKVERGRRNEGDTHIKVFEDEINFERPPGLEAWRKAVLKRLSRN